MTDKGSDTKDEGSAEIPASDECKAFVRVFLEFCGLMQKLQLEGYFTAHYAENRPKAEVDAGYVRAVAKKYRSSESFGGRPRLLPALSIDPSTKRLSLKLELSGAASAGFTNDFFQSLTLIENAVRFFNVNEQARDTARFTRVNDFFTLMAKYLNGDKNIAAPERAARTREVLASMPVTAGDALAREIHLSVYDAAGDIMRLMGISAAREDFEKWLKSFRPETDGQKKILEKINSLIQRQMRKTLEGFSTDLTGDAKLPDGGGNLPQIKAVRGDLARAGMRLGDPAVPSGKKAVAPARPVDDESWEELAIAPEFSGQKEKILREEAAAFRDYLMKMRALGMKLSTMRLGSLLSLLFGMEPGWCTAAGGKPRINWQELEKLNLRSCFGLSGGHEENFFLQIYWWQMDLAEKGLQGPKARRAFLHLLGRDQELR